jgi:hypothetical protein
MDQMLGGDPVCAAAIGQLVLPEGEPFYAEGAVLATPMRSMGSVVSSTDYAVAYPAQRAEALAIGPRT